MQARRLLAALACAALATGAAACGGDDEEEAGGAQTATAPAADTATETESEPAAGGGDGELTPPGTKLKVGDTARVGWQPPSAFGGGEKTFDLEVTIVALEERSQDDLEGINLDAEQKQATPYFLKVKIENVGDEAPPETDDPDVTLDAIDDRGQEQGSITFIGDFPPCEDEQPPKPFAKGKSYESCLTYLVPPGGSLNEVRWKSGPPEENGVSEYFEKPVVWEAG
jgi:hypothetical protein